MSPEQIAAQFYLDTQASTSNLSLEVLRLIVNLKDKDASKVLEIFEDLLSKKKQICIVESKSDLNDKIHAFIEAEVKKKLTAELIFIYRQNENLLGGLLVRVDDDVIDLSIDNKINAFIK